MRYYNSIKAINLKCYIVLFGKGKSYMKHKLGSKYIKEGITLFLTGAALILFFRFITNFDGVTHAVSLISKILSPFIIGMVMAYLLCPIYNWGVKNAYSIFSTIFKKKDSALKFSRVIATFVALVFMIGVVGGFLWLVIPELIESILGIVQVLPDRMKEVVDWAEQSINKYPQIVKTFEGAVTEVTDKVITWAQNEFLPGAGVFMSGVSQGIIGTVTTMINVFIGVIICVYFLNSKEKFKAQSKKIILATVNKESAEEIFDFGNFTNKTFGGFINGKIIDSIIIGILCFIAMTAMKLPLPTLISVIIGFTNIIPFFGPFIGAIPSTLIIFLIDPIKAIYFLIMVFVLQQIDGNIIGPRILGESTGLASFWVMFAIIVGGGIFGFVGMILGVPLFAVFYYYFGRYIKKRLAKKSLPTETIEYEEFKKYNINKEDLI